MLTDYKADGYIKKTGPTPCNQSDLIEPLGATAIKNIQIKILRGALETIIDMTHCTCAQYRQDPALLCPTCMAISAIDSAEVVGVLPR